MTTPTTTRTEVLIVGAGQAGLSAGHELAVRGIPFLIVHADDRVGDQWRRRWASLRLYSPAVVDALPGMPFPAKRLHFPSGTEMADYLEAYAAHFDLLIEHGVKVERIERAADGDGFVITAGERRYEAEQVIVAAGSFRTPHVPAFASELDGSIRQIHSVDYRSPAQLADGPVVVVGASHSGADIAHEAALAGHPTVLAGRVHGQFPVPYENRFGQLVFGSLLFLGRYVLTLRTPIGRRMAVEVRKGGGPLLRVRRQDLAAVGVELTEQRITGVVDGRPQLADGRVLDAATVVWSTGFTPDFGWVEPAPLDEGGWPIQVRGVVESAPGLYFVGLLFQYAFSSMLVAGVGRDAAYVVEHLARRRAELARGAGAGESVRRATAA
jgi:putative flavoprotein involved in K+ transport